jgi:hypothetical protein
MKDHNHDLVQALHHVNDQNWRIEKYYLPNSKGEDTCTKLWQEMRKDGRKHEQLLTAEIAKHVEEKRFD